MLLGSQDTAADLPLLLSLGVTRVLNAAPRAVPNFFPETFAYKEVHLLDTPEQDLLCDIDSALDFIDNKEEEDDRDKAGVTLAHCNAGVSRSAALSAAYLMRSLGLRAEEAVARVRAVRPAARPNQGFLKGLKEYEERLNARGEGPGRVSSS